MERQGGWSELAETRDGPHLWRGPNKRKEGRHFEEDRAGGTAEMPRHKGGHFGHKEFREGEDYMDSGGWKCGGTAPVARLH